MPFVARSTLNLPKQESSVTSQQTDKAFPISEPKYKLADLIMPDALRDELDTIIKAQECWKKVFVEWNFESVMKQRKNLFVNLYGAPGTGKTMAAHAIANALKKR